MSAVHSPAGQSVRPSKVVSKGQRRLKTALYVVGGALLLLILLAAASFLGMPSTAASNLSTPVELTSIAEGGISANLRDSQGHFHLLYTTAEPRVTYDLMYQEVSVAGQNVRVLAQPVALATEEDQIRSPTLVLDSQGRVHAAWIEVSNGLVSVRQALVASPTNQSISGDIVPQTLYSSHGAVTGLSAGADGQGNTFYAWQDNASGSLNLRIEEVDATQVAQAPIQVTHQTDGLAFAHLVAYPDGTLTAVMLHQSPQGGWDLNLYPFDATGKALHDPTLVASQLRPDALNQPPKDTNDFQNDPLVVKLDAQRTLHIAWASVGGLGYASAILRSDDSFAVQASTLDQSAPDHAQLCLNVGPPTPPGQAASGGAAQVWLSWLDDHLGSLSPYIAQISPQGRLIGTPMPLVDTVTTAAVPCVQQDSQKGLYITWQQFDDSTNTYGLVMATTTVAPQIPWWTRLGLSLNHPIAQIFFIVFGSPVLALLIGLVDLLGVPVAAVIVRLGKWLRIPRLLVLLIALAPLLVISFYIQGFLAANFNVAVPLIRSLVGCVAAVGVIVYLWSRNRRFPPETLGTIGQLMLASYIGAIVLAAPIIYFATITQLA